MRGACHAGWRGGMGVVCSQVSVLVPSLRQSSSFWVEPDKSVFLGHSSTYGLGSEV